MSVKAPPAPKTEPKESLADLAPEPVKDEVDRLLDEPGGPLTLASGTVVTLRPLKLREFLKLLKIITRGAGTLLQDLQLDFEDATQFTQTLLAVVLFAVPEAEDETIEFIQTIVEPTELSGDLKEQAGQRLTLMRELENPELEDMIEILTALIRAEGRDLQSLGKRLRVMFQTAQKLGALKTK